MRYFKIKTGYGDQDFISIDETELEAAVYAFLTDAKGMFKNGAVNGKNIMSITEDWHREFGWNYTYKLGPDDWEQINREATPKYRGIIQEAKDRVQGYISKGTTNKIGKEPLPLMITSSLDKHWA